MHTDWIAARREHRLQCPYIEAIEGEDPADILWQPIRMDTGDGTRGQLIFARIRGMESLSLLESWRYIERRIHDGGRARVLDALDQREDALHRKRENTLEREPVGPATR